MWVGGMMGAGVQKKELFHAMLPNNSQLNPIVQSMSCPNQDLWEALVILALATHILHKIQ